MMKMTDYNAWSDFLFGLEAAVSPPELQGMVCGRLCGGQRLDKAAWFEAAVEFLDLVEGDPEITLDDDSRDNLAGLYQQSLASLEDPNQPLELLLPPDELGLSQRIEGLADWCSGFLHGVGASGLDGSRQLPAEVAEALRDLAQIAQAELDEQEDEENEHYYTELVEYVRVAVLTLFTELNAAPRQVH